MRKIRLWSKAGYDHARSVDALGGRLNYPHLAEMATFIEIPISPTTFCDLYAPMIVIGGNCENKCNRNRHDHSAQNSNEKYAPHFVCPHSLTLLSKVAVTPVFYFGAINPKRLWCVR